MELEQLLVLRKSCRAFNDVEVPMGIVDSILWAGERAPYASGGPRRKLIVVRDKETKMKLQEACAGQTYVGSADSVFICCGFDRDIPGNVMRNGQEKKVADCYASVMCMNLASEDKGLGSCWIGNFEVCEVKDVLQVAEQPIIILVVGFAK